MVINHPRHTECSNITHRGKMEEHMRNRENNFEHFMGFLNLLLFKYLRLTPNFSKCCRKK